MKGRTVLVIVFISLFSIALASFQYGQASAVRTMATFFTPPEESLPPNIDELLKKDYGNSQYFDKSEDIKVSLEKAIHERYFVEYNWADGDESYFALGLVLENLNKEPLNKEDFKSIWIEDDMGNTYMPLPYYEISDFPKDQPLGWKQLFYGKFSPIDTSASSIHIYFEYQDHRFEIKEVPIT